MDNLHIVTVATEPKYYFKYLQETCKNNGKELEVLGYGEKWQGFNWRLYLMIEYLKELNPTDIVVFIDGYDVLCIKNLLDFKDKFFEIKNKENCKIIVAEDKGEFFIISTLTNLYFGNCKDKRINAGTYAGLASDLLEILSFIRTNNSDNKADDQVLLTSYCNLNQKDFYIDINNELFMVAGEFLNDIGYRANIINNEVIIDNKYKPFFIHAPGSSYLDGVLKKIGINCDNISNSIHEDFWNKTVYSRIEHFLYTNEYLIIILLIIFVSIVFFFKIKNKKSL